MHVLTCIRAAQALAEFPLAESRIPSESRIPNNESRIPSSESRIPESQERIPNPRIEAKTEIVKMLVFESRIPSPNTTYIWNRQPRPHVQERVGSVPGDLKSSKTCAMNVSR